MFVLFIIGSTLYPLWDEIRGRKENQTKATYVFATGRVSVFAIMLSIARGSLGVRAFIGNFHLFFFIMFFLAINTFSFL